MAHLVTIKNLTGNMKDEWEIYTESLDEILRCSFGEDNRVDPVNFYESIGEYLKDELGTGAPFNQEMHERINKISEEISKKLVEDGLDIDDVYETPFVVDSYGGGVEIDLKKMLDAYLLDYFKASHISYKEIPPIPGAEKVYCTNPQGSELEVSCYR